MKPIKVFLFFFLIILFIALLALLIPKKGIQVGDVTLRFIDPENIFKREKPDYKDLSAIIDTAAFKTNDTNTIDQLTWHKFFAIDSPTSVYYINGLKTKGQDTTGVKIENIRHRIHPLEYPDGNKALLYNVFAQLNRLSQTGELIHILHFGDSQIEGDRITCVIRNELQKKFGGAGAGLFPIERNKYRNVSFNLDVSGNWYHYTIKDRHLLPSRHRNFGVLLSFSTFSKLNASGRVDQNAVQRAKFTMHRPPYSYPLARRYKKVRMFYGFNKKPCIVQMKCQDKALDAEILEPSNELNVLTWNFQNPPHNFTVEFQGENSPDIFGFSLDNTWGVTVDNIPMRGSSGLEFTKTNFHFFNAMYDHLNVKLIILQFGVNVVPAMEKKYDYYEYQFYKQLRYLKKMNPNTPIIVMGVSDMSRQVYGYYISYPNIEAIRDSQKRATFRAGCVFWDVYEAMGGQNSMPSWVFADPPLAAKDFTHFTYKGSQLIAKMFSNSFLSDYQQYLKRMDAD
jgi:hypothetical protein